MVVPEVSNFMREARLAFEYSLSNFIWNQAVFFAERLVAEGPCDETSYLLALAYFHNQETGRAYWRLRGNRLPEARYLLARCCFLLQKWEEAEEALEGVCPSSPPGGSLAEVVNGGAGLFLLGQVKEKRAKREQAIESYSKCLELCPFMWDAYERWSWLILGSSPSRPAAAATAGNFAATTFSDEKFSQSFAQLGGAGGLIPGLGGAGANLSATVGSRSGSGPGLRLASFNGSPLSTANAALPNGGGGGVGRPSSFAESPPSGGGTGPARPALEQRGGGQQQVAAPGRSGSGPSGLGGACSPGGGAAGAARSQNAPPRNERGDASQHHHHHTQGLRKERRGGASDPLRGHGASHQHGAAREAKEGASASRRPAADSSSAAHGHGNSATQSSEGSEVTLASLLCKLGAAVHAMHNFEGTQAIQTFSTLPQRHYETGHVLLLVGLCYFELADYKRAEQIFQQVWRMEPQRIEGLEYYSSALWHLRKDIELGHLAQRCLQWDRLRPQVWCVVGNCFSLQNEHDLAIKFFKRAIQVDPSFTYAYTLCGHEFVANEKFDKAIPMYRYALEVDSRHYNAWWGLGNIYQRQEEHENARYHFLRALEINSHNSVLRCYLGMVLESLNNPLMALENFDRASQGEPQNGMAYFQKACVLMALDRYEEALADLKKVRCMAPKEACVHFQLGKVYMRLKRDRKALLHFNIAMDLNRDSKDYHTIKTHIERLHLRGVRETDALALGAEPSAAGASAATTAVLGGTGALRRHSRGGMPRSSSSSSAAGDDVRGGLDFRDTGLAPPAHGSHSYGGQGPPLQQAPVAAPMGSYTGGLAAAPPPIAAATSPHHASAVSSGASSVGPTGGGGGTQAAPPRGHHHGATAATAASGSTFMAQHYVGGSPPSRGVAAADAATAAAAAVAAVAGVGMSASGPAVATGPPTPGVARGYGSAISRSLWSTRGSNSGGGGGRSGGSSAGERGSGGSPSAWGGTPGSSLHGSGPTNFRI